jgi:hypothetical protein
MPQQAELLQEGNEAAALQTSGACPAPGSHDPQALKLELEAARRALEEQTARATALDRELEEAGKALREEQQQVQRLGAELAAALGRYRLALLAAAPDIPPELVQGETVAALDEALARAKALVDRVRRQVEAQAARERVPPGAPARSRADLSSLSPQEKILVGLRQLQP